MTEQHAKGLIDTSVVIDLDRIEISRLPDQLAVCAITMAELAAGPHAATTAAERALRQDRLQRAIEAFDPIPFDDECARAYGRVYAALTTKTHEASGVRVVDLLIVATAVAAGLPVYTRNGGNLAGLSDLIDIIEV